MLYTLPHLHEHHAQESKSFFPSTPYIVAVEYDANIEKIGLRLILFVCYTFISSSKCVKEYMCIYAE